MTTPNENCFFCGTKADDYHGGWEAQPCFYRCKKCGPIKLTENAVDDITVQKFSAEELHKLRIILRNGSFLRGNRPPENSFSSNDLKMLISLYRPLDPLDKMDHALLTLDRLTKKAGERIKIPLQEDLYLYHCSETSELQTILTYLVEQGDIKAQDPENPHNKLWITAKGYQTLRDLKQSNKNSRTCFVAMWFTPDMKRIFDNAIKPAIEFIEEGQAASRFVAVKVDEVEHTDDINDKTIALIRRSRFMVCDLTGYRGGVYFEAGFAYGLGLPVIYTCRKDWCREEKLRDKDKNEIEALWDCCGREIRVRKEGVHFDLAHRNRIEWQEDNLDEFRVALENRIKAVIV